VIEIRLQRSLPRALNRVVLQRKNLKAGHRREVLMARKATAVRAVYSDVSFDSQIHSVLESRAELF
jgi:hypothetical protein